MTTPQVSHIMSCVRSKDTRPELIVRKYLWHRGYRYRKNDKRLPGKPDVVLKKYAVVIFIHGCFWHGHGHSIMPKTNAQFWKDKIKRNKERDKHNELQLKQMGWSVMTVWECQLKKDQCQKTLREIEYWLNKNYLERIKIKGRYSSPPEDLEMAAEPDL